MISELLLPSTTGMSFLDILMSGILILLSVIGWFLKGFSSSVKELKLTVENLITTVAVEQERINNVKETIGEFFTQLDNKVTFMRCQVDKHERDIAILKTLENEYHKTIL